MEVGIASELMSIIDAKKYKQIIPALVAGTGLSEELFGQTSLAERYSLDTNHWLDGSYMNPGALFELFGAYNNETALQVRKRMLKFLGITKKRGADSCAILKNAWISLHMKGLSAREWADKMFMKDTPGEEIAIYALCKMYKRHCMIFTTAKCWSTLETSEPLSEAELFELCDIWLLYIELGVFGELRMKPKMPPAPLEHGIFESATAIIGNNRDYSMNTSTSPPLNLSKPPHADQKDHAEPWNTTSDNGKLDTNIVNAANMRDESEDRFDPYQDARLSGCIERLRGELELEEILSNVLASSIGTLYLKPEHDERDLNEPDVPEFPNFSEPRDNSKEIPTMNDCMVRLDVLTNTEIESWLNPVQSYQIGGHTLRNMSTSVKPARLARNAKSQVSYKYSDSSQGEDTDYEVKPGRWSKGKPIKAHLPLGGPSKARMSAQ